MYTRSDTQEKRRVYAKARLRAAMKRLLLAGSAQDEENARHWVNA